MSTLPPADFPPPPQTDPPPPHPTSNLQTISICSIVAPLAKLNLRASTEDFLKVTHDQKEAKLTAEAAQHHAAPSERKSAPTSRPPPWIPSNAPSRSPTNRANHPPRYIPHSRTHSKPYQAHAWGSVVGERHRNIVVFVRNTKPYPGNVFQVRSQGWVRPRTLPLTNRSLGAVRLETNLFPIGLRFLPKS